MLLTEVGGPVVMRLSLQGSKGLVADRELGPWSTSNGGRAPGERQNEGACQGAGGWLR